MNNTTSQKRDPLTTTAFALAFVSCLFGLSLFLIKSPQAKSADYLVLSKQVLASDPDLAASAAWEAARLNPSSSEAWDVLSQSLQQKGDRSAAQKAKVIAMRLHKNPHDKTPLYAMPAELRLSFLASSNGDL